MLEAPRPPSATSQPNSSAESLIPQPSARLSARASTAKLSRFASSRGRPPAMTESREREAPALDTQNPAGPASDPGAVSLPASARPASGASPGPEVPAPDPGVPA